VNAASTTPAPWAARLRLDLQAGVDRTRLVPRERYGPLAVQRPFYPEGDCCHVYLLHPPGGVVGGDSLDLLVDLEPDASALMTSPGAAKFYYSDGAEARVEQRFKLAGDARLEFLPQANIYFPGARVRMHTELDVDPGGRLVLWEKHCFGRPANRESFDSGHLLSRLDLRRGGQLIYTETQRIDAAEIGRSSGLRGHAVSGTLLVLGDALDAVELLDMQPRGLLCGITQPQQDLLVARCLGNSTAALEDYFIQIWENLRPAMLDREPCRPRIWNT